MSAGVGTLLTVAHLVMPKVIRHGQKRVVGVNSVTKSTTCPKNDICYTAGTTIGTLSSKLHVSLISAPLEIAGVGPKLIRAGFSIIHFQKSGRGTSGMCGNVHPLAKSSVTRAICFTTSMPRCVRVTRVLIVPAGRTAKAVISHGWGE